MLSSKQTAKFNTRKLPVRLNLRAFALVFASLCPFSLNVEIFIRQFCCVLRVEQLKLFARMCCAHEKRQQGCSLACLPHIYKISALSLAVSTKSQFVSQKINETSNTGYRSTTYNEIKKCATYSDSEDFLKQKL